MSNNTDGMNVFEAIEYKEFAEGKNIKAISTKITGAKKVAETFRDVASKISSLSREIDGDVGMINEYANAKQIKALNELVEVLTAKLEIFEDKKVISSIDDLATIFKINGGAKKANKKDLTKSLGL